MHNYINNPLYKKVNDSFVLLERSIQNFDKSLHEKNLTELKKAYYFARNCRRAGEEYYQRALNNTRSLTIPYTNFLEKNQILVKVVTFKDVAAEITGDKAIRNWMSEEETKAFLKDYFIEQTKGRRKIFNIKLRMVLKKLEKLLSVSQELEEKAKKHCINRISQLKEESG